MLLSAPLLHFSLPSIILAISHNSSTSSEQEKATGNLFLKKRRDSQSPFQEDFGLFLALPLSRVPRLSAELSPLKKVFC